MSGLLKLGPGGMADVRCVLGERSIYFAAGLSAVLGSTENVRVAAHASDPDELLSCVARSSPDVVLVGFEPIAESIALASRVRSGPPVVVLTSSVDEESYSSALSAGVERVVRKDATVFELTMAILRTAGTSGIQAEQDDGHMSSRHPATERSNPRSRQNRTLTPREEEIVQLVVEGWSSKQIARTLDIAPQTVKNHLYNVMSRVGASSRVRLCMWALETGHANRTAVLSER